MDSVDVTLSVGSNTDGKAESVANAIDFLGRILDDFRASSIYSTPEIHGNGDIYMNAVVCGSTSQQLPELSAMLKTYEINCGRTPEARKKGEVPIDIDIVIWDGEIIRQRDYSCSFFQLGFKQL